MSSPAPANRGEILWQPPLDRAADCRLARFEEWLAARGHDFPGYEELWEWSVAEPGAFWAAVADYFEILFHSRAAEPLVDADLMPGARWFPGATLNYAEHALRRRDHHPAILFQGEPGPDGAPNARSLSRAELAAQVAAFAAALRAMGVRAGDRVAGYLPNIPETVVAFLAAASLGAIWTSCPAELSARGVVEKFSLIGPKVLVAVDGYRYGGKAFERHGSVGEIAAGLPTLTHVVMVRGLGAGSEPGRPDETRAGITVESWPALLAANARAELRFEGVPFEHPLWILYSSGTTGAPKAIVQGHGGILLEHAKALALHLDLGPGDRFFWFTTAGWMMWNFLVSGLVVGATVVLYDGSPKYPDLRALWAFCAENKVTYFGTSAPFLVACMKEGISPRGECELGALRAIGSTGSPLPPEGFRWVYEHVSPDVLLGSVSGGTDVCTAFILSHPQRPVRAGEIQCRGLGAAVEAWDEERRPLRDAVGELVLTKPFPSMPVKFWNDADGAKLRAAYFEHFPGAWRHGDWIKVTSGDAACVVYGRSDSTLNRGGVRMGTSEFYRVVEELPEIADSLVVDTGALGRDGRLLLFIVLREGVGLSDALRDALRARIRVDLSPRHLPDEIIAIPEVPKTLNGKKLEVPVKRILLGQPPEKAASAGAMANPASLKFFVQLAQANS